MLHVEFFEFLLGGLDQFQVRLEAASVPDALDLGR
jgi:hypothetical protein